MADHGPVYGPGVGRARRRGPRETPQPQFDVSTQHTTLLPGLDADISHEHTTLLSEPPTPTLPRTQRLSAVPHVTRPEPPQVRRPERTDYLSRLPSGPLILPELPRLPENPWKPDAAAVRAGAEAETEAQARERMRAQAQREAETAEAVRWRGHADEVSEQIQRDTEQFAAMTARWRTLVHTSHRSQHEDLEMARLEVEVPRLSQRLARARKRWTECLAQARQYEERAARP